MRISDLEFRRVLFRSLHISDQGFVALRFSANEKVRERRAGHALLFALVERTKAGDKICLNREGGKQGLAETMDRLDAEAAAAGVENAGKKGAGAFLRFRPMILAQSHQVHGERGAVHLHPCSQAVTS